MDPTQPQMPGQQAAPAMDPQMLQNLMMLQAIKSGAAGGAADPTASTQAMGPPGGMASPMPAPSPTAPVDPSTMAGGLGNQNQMAMPQQGMMQQQPQSNPVVNALMSQIPGGGQ